jgi:hypothetical protein
MTDLNNVRDVRHGGQIDSVGWTFAAVAIVITAVAGIVAYQGSGTTSASSPAHVVASR